MELQKWLGSLLLALSLSGCGGEDRPDKPQPVEVERPIASDNYTQVLLSDEVKMVSLQDSIEDPQGLPLSLESVVPLSENCPTPELDSKNLAFFIDKSVPDTCYYSYTVTNHPTQGQAEQASANSFVLVSETETSSLLPPLSEKAVVNETIHIDLNKKLSDQIPENYLLEDSILVLGDGHAYTESPYTIVYAATDQGTTRLIYTLSSSDGQNVLAGYIDVAVSKEASSAPLADNFVGPQDVAIGATVTVDVAEHVSDPEGDQLQLIDVYAYNATVNIVSPTQFTFSSEQSGTHHINYVVTDNKGGYAAAMVYISVKEAEPPTVVWEDIVLPSGEVYTAPYDQRGADVYGYIYQQVVPETIASEDYLIPLFNYESAKNVCITNGWRLPTLTQLEALYDERGDVNISDNWPTSSPYWSVSDAGRSSSTVDLGNGEVTSDVNFNIPHLVTCVYQGELSAEVIKNNAYVDDGIEPADYNSVKAIVSLPTGDRLEGETVYLWTSEESLLLNQTQQQTDDQGQVTYDIRGTESGDFTIFLNYLSQTVQQTITFKEYPDELIELTVTPQNVTLAEGESQKFTATATYQRSGEKDVTDQAKWRVVGNGSITQEGIYKAGDEGEAVVVATYEGMVTQANVDVVRLTLEKPEELSMLVIDAYTDIANGDYVEQGNKQTYSDDWNPVGKVMGTGSVSWDFKSYTHSGTRLDTWMMRTTSNHEAIEGANSWVTSDIYDSSEEAMDMIEEVSHNLEIGYHHNYRTDNGNVTSDAYKAMVRCAAPGAARVVIASQVISLQCE